MRRRVVLAGLVAFGALAIAAGAQVPRPSASAIKVQQIANNLFVLNALSAGGGGNTSVFITATGVVVVDTKNPGWGRPLLDVIRTLTPKPVTLIINTHTHGDHVSGNVEFPATVDVVTHENTRTNMAAMRPAAFVTPPAGGWPPNIFAVSKGVGMPKRTFKDSLAIGQGVDRIELHYFGRAHTDGDAMVFFTAPRVLHVADVFPTKGLPGMDANNGGTGVGYASTLTRVADFADRNDVTAIVNGHFQTTTSRAELRQYVQYIRDFVGTVQEGKKAGKTVDDVARAWATPAKYAGYEAKPILERARANAELIFKETD